MIKEPGVSSNYSQVKCTSTLFSLCRVSRNVYHLATPKLYRKLGLLFKGSSEVRIANLHEDIIDDSAIERNSTPFTDVHWNHLRHVQSLVIRDCRQGCSTWGCANFAHHWARGRVECPDVECNELKMGCGVLGKIMLGLPGLTEFAWQSGESNLGIPMEVLTIVGHRDAGRLDRLQLEMFRALDELALLENLDQTFSAMKGLKKLQLSMVSQRRVWEVVGKYLQSPSGSSIRDLRLEGTRGILGHISTLDNDTVDSWTAPKLEIESLCLQNFWLQRSTLSSVLNPNTLTCLRLINCPISNSYMPLHAGDRRVTYPNLKILHLSSTAEQLTGCCDSLPVLEELIIDISARAERQYHGSVTRFLQKNGHGLKSLGVDFTQDPRRDQKYPRSNIMEWKSAELAFMEIIKTYCQNLEELGIWGTDLFVRFIGHDSLLGPRS